MQAEQRTDLRRKDGDRYAAGKTNRHWMWHKFDQTAQPQRTHRKQNNPGHHRAEQEVPHAILRHHQRDQSHEGSGWPADLDARTTQC